MCFMKILKRLIFVFAAVMFVSSCTFGQDQTYSASYTLDSTFEYQNVFSMSDSLFFDTQIGLGIGWQDLAFYHKLNDDKTKFQGGFMLSRLKGSGQSDDDRFRVSSGAGANKSNNYMVYYSNPNESMMPEKDIEFTAGKYGTCEVAGCYVNNTKEVLKAVESTFEDGDRLVVRMTGYKGEQQTGVQEFVLAEFTEAKDSLVTNWSVFKLDKLGEIERIAIDVVSTKPGIPAAFCLDNMVAKIAIAY